MDNFVPQFLQSKPKIDENSLNLTMGDRQGENVSIKNDGQIKAKNTGYDHEGLRRL